MTGEEIAPPEEAAGSPQRGTAARAERLSVDEALRLLSNQRRRTMLRYLMNRPNEAVAVDELVDHVVAAETSTADRQRNRDRIGVGTRCVQLPYLTDTGLVASEADTEQVRYQGDARLEALLQCVDDLYPA